MRNRRAIPWRYAAVVVPALISLAGSGISAATTAPARAVHTQPYPPSPPAGSVSTTTTCAGCTVTTTWTGFEPGSTINLTLFSHGRHLGSTTVNAEGVAVAIVTIPDDTPAGRHRITGTGRAEDGRPATASITIWVTGTEESGETEPRLPHTGADLQAPIGIGVAALTVGSLVVFSVRRRKTSDSADQ